MMYKDEILQNDLNWWQKRLQLQMNIHHHHHKLPERQKKEKETPTTPYKQTKKAQVLIKQLFRYRVLNMFS